ncbi:MAG: LysM peptidoglycan-binding domain-containing protein [Candidatus Eisenbacteria bacterium]
MRRGTCAGRSGRAHRRRAAVALLALSLAGITLLAGGCGTGGLAVKKDVWDAQNDFERRQAGLSEKVLQMEGRIIALEDEMSAIRRAIDDVGGQLSNVDSELSRGLEAVRDGQQQLGIELEGQIRTVDKDRQNDRDDALERFEIILEEVTAENRRLREEVDAIKAAVSVGFAHTVQRGETLASIASKYGVTVQELATANNISNPNLISVGQELFVPQR